MLTVIMRASLSLGALCGRVSSFIGFSNTQTWGRGKIREKAVTFWVRAWPKKNFVSHMLPIVSRPLNELIYKVPREPLLCFYMCYHFAFLFSPRIVQRFHPCLCRTAKYSSVSRDSKGQEPWLGIHSPELSSGACSVVDTGFRLCGPVDWS